MGAGPTGHADPVGRSLHPSETRRLLGAALSDGRTALVLSAERGDLPMASALVTAGATAGAEAALEAAIARREPALIKLLSSVTSEPHKQHINRD